MNRYIIVRFIGQRLVVQLTFELKILLLNDRGRRTAKYGKINRVCELSLMSICMYFVLVQNGTGSCYIQTLSYSIFEVVCL